MNVELNEVECRVLGCLIEKENTTPDYYPLTLNALTNACNQKTNREPVVDYSEEWVEQALDSLRDKNLVYVLYGSGSRTAKYKHLAPKYFELELPEVAVLCVLLLRGSQTLGELNQRTTRIYEFSGLDEVNQMVESLIRRETPLAVKLPKQPGQKEVRYAHLLSGEIDLENIVSNTPTSSIHEKNERIEKLEEKVESLENELNEFRQKFEEFKKQFE
jgi:uncharacterized protein YceH (UPF0502 family)